MAGLWLLLVLFTKCHVSVPAYPGLVQYQDPNKEGVTAFNRAKRSAVVCNGSMLHSPDHISGERPRVKLDCQRPDTGVDEHAQLICNVLSNPGAQIKWYKDGKELATLVSQKVDKLTCWRTFTIPKLSVRHAGWYTCRATNKYGSAQDSCQLRVVPAENKIHILDIKTEGRFVDGMAVIGTPLNMTCEMYFADAALWEKEGAPLLPKDNHEVLPPDSGIPHRLMLGLMFKNVTQQDEGNYSCLGYHDGLYKRKYFYLNTTNAMAANATGASSVRREAGGRHFNRSSPPPLASLAPLGLSIVLLVVLY